MQNQRQAQKQLCQC